MPEISIQAEKIFSLGSFPVTNSLIMSILVLAALSIAAVFVYKNLKIIPGKIQSVVEIFLEGVMDFMDTILGNRKATELYLPLLNASRLYNRAQVLTLFLPSSLC